ncbi:MAG TPA: hypothetical protein VFG76_12595, partial [Candidatus Polarisedimenticolia bacterium]|nr:hypothetical protein [Candidatus Polarisedimenticolia bacterium]
WGPAENLGPTVNSKGSEFEPLVAPDGNTLIFMAMKQGGLGGGDLYVTRRRDGAWTTPVNLGEPINSASDEYSPALSPDGRSFLWASARGFGANPLPMRLDYRALSAKLDGPGNGLGDIYTIERRALDAR